MQEPNTSSIPANIHNTLHQFMRQHFMRINALLDEIGIYRGQPPLLHQLWENDGCAQTDLVTNQHLAPATVTKMLQRMEQAGLIERRPDRDDQRVMRVYLTDTARSLEDAIREREQQINAEMLTGFDESEKAQLLQYLLRLRDNLMAVNSRKDN